MNILHMRQLIVVILIVSMIFVFVIPGKAFAWPPSQDGFSLFLAVAGITFGYISYRLNLAEEKKLVGWIEAKITDATYKEQPWWVIRCKILENGYVYPSPSERNKTNGYVIKSEWYEIINIINNDEGLWYKIRFSKDHKDNNLF